MSAEEDRREYMWARYGRPEIVDAQTALDALGITDVNPRRVVAFRYRDQEAAIAYAESNLEHHGHENLGAYGDGPSAIIGVLDLGPAIDELQQRARRTG